MTISGSYSYLKRALNAGIIYLKLREQGKIMPTIYDGIQNFHSTELFSQRRNNSPNAGNPYNPESLYCGVDLFDGPRNYPDQDFYDACVRGEISTEIILELAPRVNRNDYTKRSLYRLKYCHDWDNNPVSVVYHVIEETNGVESMSQPLYHVPADLWEVVLAGEVYAEKKVFGYSIQTDYRKIRYEEDLVD
jgi:hypothetical protein